MVLSEGDKAIIVSCFEEKGWRGRRLCREFKSKQWKQTTVDKLIRKFEQSGSADRKKGSGRPCTATTEENENDAFELLQSQEGEPGTHQSLRKTARILHIGKSSVQRISRKKITPPLKSYKRMKTPAMPEGTRQRRLARAAALLTRFPRLGKVKRITFQDEKDFTLQICTNRQNNRVYSQGKKGEIAPERLFHRQNKQSVKLMVSACISWNGVTPPFFIDPAKAKVNAVYYRNHLRRQLLPACNRLYPEGDFIFMQDGATSHTANICQSFLLENLGRGRFISKTEWPPCSPECNLMDFYFWDAVAAKVYEGRREPFRDVDELKAAIKRAWRVVVDIDAIRAAVKQFRPRLQEVVNQQGGPIQHIFG